MQMIKQLYSRFTPSNGNLSLFAFAVALGLLMIPELSFAAETMKDVSERVEGQFTSLKSMVLAVGFFIGTVLFVSGLWLIYKDSKQPGQGHAKNGFIAMLVGAGLLIVQTLVGITAETVTETGDDATNSIEAEKGF